MSGHAVRLINVTTSSLWQLHAEDVLPAVLRIPIVIKIIKANPDYSLPIS
jgi:hypothetical protein